MVLQPPSAEVGAACVAESLVRTWRLESLDPWAHGSDGQGGETEFKPQSHSEPLYSGSIIERHWRSDSIVWILEIVGVRSDTLNG